MRKSKIYKFLGVLILLAFIGGGIWYWQLPTRHKAILKSFLFEKLGVVNPNVFTSVVMNQTIYQNTFSVKSAICAFNGKKHFFANAFF